MLTEEQREYHRQYRQTAKNKEYMRLYRQTDKWKNYQHEHYLRRKAKRAAALQHEQPTDTI